MHFVQAEVFTDFFGCQAVVTMRELQSMKSISLHWKVQDTKSDLLYLQGGKMWY